MPIFISMGTHLKTTIDIHDELFRQAREHAAETGTTLRALVEEGLRCVLDHAAEPQSAPPFEVRVFTGYGDSPGLAAPYLRLGLHRVILDSYRSFDDEGMAVGAVHDRP
jgi:hypothetical protein